MKTFLIVDDHAIIREGVKSLLLNSYPEIKIDEAINGVQCEELVNNTYYDIIILDINMPDTNTLQLVDWLVQHHRNSKILIFSMFSCLQYAMFYYKKGVAGYLNKDADCRELLIAVDAILNKGIYVDLRFQSNMSVLFAGKGKNGLEILSEREFAVAQNLAQGMRHNKIATFLNISPGTVRTFKVRIFKKLRVSSMYEFLKLMNGGLHEVRSK